jgi:Holliday junction resolvase-like predicted endonuclease
LRAWLPSTCAWIACRGGTETLFYWRTRAGREVDVVVCGLGTVVALEVKRSRSVQRRDLAGLKAFREDYDAVRAAADVVLMCCGCLRAARVRWQR